MALRCCGVVLEPDHPTYSRAQVAGITVEDARAFLATWQRPDTAVMGLVGDFDAAEMQQLVEEAGFGGWTPPSGTAAVPSAAPPRSGEQPAAAAVASKLPPPPLPSPRIPDQSGIGGRIYLVDLPGATQSSVAVGELGALLDRVWRSEEVLLMHTMLNLSLPRHAGIQMGDPDEWALEVLGQIFDGFGCVGGRAGLPLASLCSFLASRVALMRCHAWLPCPAAAGGGCSTRFGHGTGWPTVSAPTGSQPRWTTPASSWPPPTRSNPAPCWRRCGARCSRRPRFRPPPRRCSEPSRQASRPRVLYGSTHATCSQLSDSPTSFPLHSLLSMKQETVNSFVFSFASKPAQLQRIAVFELMGIPQDYLFR